MLPELEKNFMDARIERMRLEVFMDLAVDADEATYGRCADALDAAKSRSREAFCQYLGFIDSIAGT